MWYLDKKDRAKVLAAITKSLQEVYKDRDIEMREDKAQSFAVIDFCLEGNKGNTFRVAIGKGVCLGI